MKNSNGKVIIFSAPSGAGKSTIVSHLLDNFKWLSFSISATSRAPRGNEEHGKEYYFLSSEEFKEKIELGEFVEYEEVYPGRFYGTLKSEVKRIWGEDRIVLFDIDVIGGINLKKLYGDKALSIFVMPPSLDALRERLKSRGTDNDEAIETRLSKASAEISLSGEFDKIIINDNLAECLNMATAIVVDFYNR